MFVDIALCLESPKSGVSREMALLCLFLGSSRLHQFASQSDPGSITPAGKITRSGTSTAL